MEYRPGDIEAIVGIAWREALGSDDFTNEDSFFDVGGDSMKFANVFYLIRENLGVSDLSLLDMFRNPTISSYSMHLYRVVSIQLE